MNLHSGLHENLPYSLSRWTDVPAAKWGWFLEQLTQGWMIGFDPRTAIPSRWSLAPADVLGLTFWTKNPQNLIKDHARLASYPLVIHVTLTGWGEVERGAPDVELGSDLIRQTAELFGPERVVWRFSPVPQLPLDEVVSRFERIARKVRGAGLKKVYVAFLQANDLMPEARLPDERSKVLSRLGQVGESLGMQILLCRDDQTTPVEPLPNLLRGVCEDGSIFGAPVPPPREGCGCALSVDPFTINESCTLGCRYCYAADRSLSNKKRNTTLRVFR